MSFHNRPSVSPVVATLFANGTIKKRHAVIDLGCGNGIDCVTLASWGIRRVVGIDLEEENLNAAQALARRYKIKCPELHGGSITQEHECFGRAEFDVAIDSLLWNNISAHATPGYVRQVSRILKPGGLLIMQVRSDVPRFDFGDAHDSLPPSFGKQFTFGPVVTTHLPEFKTKGRRRGHAQIALVVGRKRSRPSRS